MRKNTHESTFFPLLDQIRATGCPALYLFAATADRQSRGNSHSPSFALLTVAEVILQHVVLAKGLEVATRLLSVDADLVCNSDALRLSEADSADNRESATTLRM